MKKTCRKRKVDSNDGDKLATKKLKSLNQTSLKGNNMLTLKPIEGTWYYHDDFDREVELRGGNHGNPWPEELIRLQRINFPSLFDEGSWSIFPTPSFCTQPPKVLYQEA
ncbi:hypothetical protein E2562_003201 [Oryza meyeriana var. granulata]|uniref:Uncharacterized protein n=1 Tax=Oryza meyeriana var. granulata TaxID=110450 RepID=A0A6G1EUY7_9ORYZ|nr:hypothetical protein E2562_003201 [Oryza meyeriana var. granulata]